MPNLKICKYEQFNEMVEYRVKRITSDKFDELLEKTNQENFLYKKIYNPTFTFGIFKKSYKQAIDSHINTPLIERTDSSYPKKSYSLVCSTTEENSMGTTFLVFPLKESLFAIKESEDYFKGYWKDKIKWLEKFKDNQLWTENDCILIKKKVWDDKFRNV